MRSNKIKKAIIIFFFLLLMIIVGVMPLPYHVKSFSYTSDYNFYASWSKCSGFNNTSLCKVKSVENAVELAKNEIEVRYNRIKVYYDETEQIWKVSFYMKDYIGGSQSVYINKDGITLMRVNF